MALIHDSVTRAQQCKEERPLHPFTSPHANKARVEDGGILFLASGYNFIRQLANAHSQEPKLKRTNNRQFVPKIDDEIEGYDSSFTNK